MGIIQKNIFWHTYLKLENKLLQVSKYVYVIDETNEN